MGIEAEIVERSPARAGFVPIPERWIVERAYGILMAHCRLMRDNERLPRSSETRVYWAMTAVILGRLTGATAAAWHSGGTSGHAVAALVAPGPLRRVVRESRSVRWVRVGLQLPVADFQSST
ncbi:hypothetical protein ACIA6D_44120 [Streptomyces cacaoi]|uniref:hypothetical protein n=1 Tax=Streptomyces cacaoi TaxID=1898 RepID=UPI003749E701